jgi:hypothetical protein
MGRVERSAAAHTIDEAGAGRRGFNLVVVSRCWRYRAIADGNRGGVSEVSEVSTPRGNVL